jgi:hypothetical protein
MRRAAHVSRLALLACLLWTGTAFGAELLLRESLLQGQRDRVTITITAVVDHLGAEAHPLGEDCDLHVPLRSREIRVPFIGEVKNACSQKPTGTPQSYWSDRLYEETHGLAVSVTGVFRIWLEPPPAGAVVQTEAERVPWYANSNPDHQVELHPVLQVGGLDFRPHVKWIETASERFEGYGPTTLPTIVNKTSRSSGAQSTANPTSACGGRRPAITTGISAPGWPSRRRRSPMACGSVWTSSAGTR